MKWLCDRFNVLTCIRSCICASENNCFIVVTLNVLQHHKNNIQNVLLFTCIHMCKYYQQCWEQDGPMPKPPGAQSPHRVVQLRAWHPSKLVGRRFPRWDRHHQHQHQSLSIEYFDFEFFVLTILENANTYIVNYITKNLVRSFDRSWSRKSLL